jgi:hypothetical protein
LYRIKKSKEYTKIPIRGLEKMTKITLIIISILLSGCLTQTRPPLSLNSKEVLMEVNSVPHPFSLAGSYPYALWVNGERFNVPAHYLNAIISEIGVDNIPEIKRGEDIHKGWIYPYFAKYGGENDERESE